MLFWKSFWCYKRFVCLQSSIGSKLWKLWYGCEFTAEKEWQVCLFFFCESCCICIYFGTIVLWLAPKSFSFSLQCVTSCHMRSVWSTSGPCVLVWLPHKFRWVTCATHDIWQDGQTSVTMWINLKSVSNMSWSYFIPKIKIKKKK